MKNVLLTYTKFDLKKFRQRKTFMNNDFFFFCFFGPKHIFPWQILSHKNVANYVDSSHKIILNNWSFLRIKCLALDCNCKQRTSWLIWMPINATCVEAPQICGLLCLDVFSSLQADLVVAWFWSYTDLAGTSVFELFSHGSKLGRGNMEMQLSKCRLCYMKLANEVLRTAWSRSI